MKDNHLDTPRSNALLNELPDELTDLLREIMKAKISFIITSPFQMHADSFLSLLLEATDNWEEITGCVIYQTQQELHSQAHKIGKHTKVVGHVVHNEQVIAGLANFQQFGFMVFYPISEEMSLTYLQALNRGQVITSLQADNYHDALQKLAQSTANLLSSIDTNEAKIWIQRQLNVVIEVFNDSTKKNRINVVDVSLQNSLSKNNTEFPSLFYFDEGRGTYVTTEHYQVFRARYLEAANAITGSKTNNA